MCLTCVPSSLAIVTSFKSLHSLSLSYVFFTLPPVCDDTQNLNETESKSFFRYQIFSIPNPILFSISIFFDTESDTIQKIGKVLKPRCFETKKFRNRNVTLCTVHCTVYSHMACCFSNRFHRLHSTNRTISRWCHSNTV